MYSIKNDKIFLLEEAKRVWGYKREGTVKRDQSYWTTWINAIGGTGGPFVVDIFLLPVHMKFGIPFQRWALSSSGWTWAATTSWRASRRSPRRWWPTCASCTWRRARRARPRSRAPRRTPPCWTGCWARWWGARPPLARYELAHPAGVPVAGGLRAQPSLIYLVSQSLSHSLIQSLSLSFESVS